MLSVSVVSDKRAKTRTNTSAETKERGYTAGHAGRKVSVESGLLSLLLLELCWNWIPLEFSMKFTYESRTEWSGRLTRNDLKGQKQLNKEVKKITTERQRQREHR